MEFEYPLMLLLLLFVPVLGLLFWLAMRQNQEMRSRFGDWAVFKQLIPDYAPGRNLLKFSLVIAAYSLLVIAVANPRIGSRTQKIKRQGIDVYIALDISKSMWAQDVTPKGIDRLEKARLLALKLVDELRGERIGLIFFAGEAFMKMPLTLDYSATQLFLNDEIDHEELMPGSAINEVLGLVVKSGATQETQRKQRALIIISDGEEHDQKGVEAARESRNNGVTTFTIAVGSEQGANIPLARDGSPGFHTDKSGQVVKTAVNKVWLKQVAEAGGGKFFDIEEGNVIIGRLRQALNTIEKEEFNEQKFDEYDTYYQYFVFLALGLLAAELLISYRKKQEKADKMTVTTDTAKPKKIKIEKEDEALVEN